MSDNKELTLKEIQQGELLILKKFKEICKKENLHYWLDYGTLIGAVRHRGFIPWDDDVDVSMFRSDYEKFLQFCRTHKEELLPLSLYHYTTKKDYIYPIARLVDTRYKVDYENTRDYNLGLFMDIYPFDGCGNSQEEKNEILKKVRRFIPFVALNSLSKVLYNHGLINYVVKCIMRSFAILVGQNRLLRHIDMTAQRLQDSNSKYVDHIIWDLSREALRERILFENLVEMKFEDDVFMVPADYGMVLKLGYGDYMQLPPENERIGHHFYKAYRK